MFPDDLYALKSIWFIGDAFLRDIFATFGAMRREAIITQRGQPFAFQFYNLSAYYQGMDATHSLLARVLNSLIEALNRNKTLLTYLFVMIDKELIHAVNYHDYGVSWILSRCLHWIAREFNKAIEGRKEQILRRCPGTMINEYVPEVIWVKALERPKWENYLENLRRSLQMVKKFNHVLDEVAEEKGHKTLTVDRIMKFDTFGNLTTSSKIEFWRIIDEQLRHRDVNTAELHNQHYRI